MFGAGVRPLHIEEALLEAMLDGWRAQQTARYLKPKTIQHNVRACRAFVGHAGAGRGSGAPRTLTSTSRICCRAAAAAARSTLRDYQLRLKGFSDYVCDRRYPWTAICEREFGRGAAAAV